MKKQNIQIAISVGLISLGFVSTADAALVSRLGGLAYYDTVADLTWLADANYAQTSGYDENGRMSWQDANAWAAQLTVGGVSGWRLPDTLQPDARCSIQNDGVSFGFSCTGSEMGDLFYNALNNNAGSLTNTGPFSNVQSDSYPYWSATDWSVTEYTSYDIFAFDFDMSSGYQSFFIKGFHHFAWAVQSGDAGLVTSAVPVPAAVWLFGSGLLGLVGVAKRKRVSI